MNPRIAACFVAVVVCVLMPSASAGDPDPLQDICVADLNSTLVLNGFACKRMEDLTVDDFFSQSLRNAQPATTPDSFIPTPLFVDQFPGLNTAGIGLLKGDLGPGGVNVPHFHPRATELVIVDQGEILVGFVDGSNRVFKQILWKGDVFIIPRAAVHFQQNVGKTPASFFSIFNSQNPGLSRLPATLFGSGIPNDILFRNETFKLNSE